MWVKRLPTTDGISPGATMAMDEVPMNDRIVSAIVLLGNGVGDLVGYHRLGAQLQLIDRNSTTPNQRSSQGRE